MTMVEMAVMSHEGDTKIIWDSENPDEVANAKRTFDDLMAKGMMAYVVKDDEGMKGRYMRTFDPSAEKMILAAPMVAG